MEIKEAGYLAGLFHERVFPAGPMPGRIDRALQNTSATTLFLCCRGDLLRRHAFPGDSDAIGIGSRYMGEQL